MFFLFKAILMFINILNFAILVRCILSWLPMSNTAFHNVIAVITEPILAPIRNMLNKSPLENTGLDLSPLIAFVLLNALARLIVGISISL